LSTIFGWGGVFGEFLRDTISTEPGAGREFFEADTIEMKKAIASLLHAVTKDGNLLIGNGFLTSLTKVDFVVVVIVRFLKVAMVNGDAVKERTELRMELADRAEALFAERTGIFLRDPGEYAREVEKMATTRKGSNSRICISRVSICVSE
jgi:hypothetical protein